MAAERAPKRRRVGVPESQSSAIPGFAQWNLEQDYEQRPRKNKKSLESNRLPIKRADGRVEQQLVEPEAAEDQGASSESEDERQSVIPKVPSDAAVKKPRLPHKEEVRQAKEELARIAGLLSESPDEHIGLLQSLEEITGSENATVTKLALGTQLAVYKDIIPGYRIRPLSRNDLQAKLSKDVRKLRNFEHGLLSGYKDYVQTLSRLAKDGRDAGVTSVALSCACALLTNVAHFNCRNDLIAMLVRKLSGRGTSPDFTRCAEALEQLFRDDEEGHASLEAVGQLTKMMKARDYNIHEAVLNTFLHLRLLSEFAHKGSTDSIDKDDEQSTRPGKKSKQKREFRTKRERKLLRERKEVEKEMKEADAVVSYEERDKNQAETLKLVFVAYFRILKEKTQHLMGAVLEGLAKYAHLINQDFFGDVLEALKDLINDSEASLQAEEHSENQDDDTLANERNMVRESLLCIITAFALLQGQQDVAKSANGLHLDLNFFIAHLYRMLLPLSLDTDVELSAKPVHLSDPNGLDVPSAKAVKVNIATTTVLLLRSLQAVLLPATASKLVPPVRIAAFTKQLLASSLHLPQKSTVAVLHLMQQVSKIHGKKIAALWNTEERRGDGVFDALSEEIASSNPFAATVWEGELLRHHFDPRVRDAVKAVEKNVVDAR